METWWPGTNPALDAGLFRAANKCNFNALRELGELLKFLHRWQNARVECGAKTALGAGDDSGIRPWIRRLSMFLDLTRQGVYWVTRLKENADYLVVEQRPVPAGGKILADEVISFGHWLNSVGQQNARSMEQSMSKPELLSQ